MTSRVNKSAARTRRFVSDFPWVHVGLGIVGNSAFFVGSVFFFWEATKTAGIWLFVVGAFGMLIGSVGEALRKYESHELNIGATT